MITPARAGKALAAALPNSAHAWSLSGAGHIDDGRACRTNRLAALQG